MVNGNELLVVGCGYQNYRNGNATGENPIKEFRLTVDKKKPSLTVGRYAMRPGQRTRK